MRRPSGLVRIWVVHARGGRVPLVYMPGVGLPRALGVMLVDPWGGGGVRIQACALGHLVFPPGPVLELLHGVMLGEVVSL